MMNGQRQDIAVEPETMTVDEYVLWKQAQVRLTRSIYLVYRLYIATLIGLVCFVGLRYPDPVKYLTGFGSDDKVCDELEKWIVDNGGIIDGIRCEFSEEYHGRALVASNLLRHRDSFFSIPVEICMWEPVVRKHSSIADALDMDAVISGIDGDEWNELGEPWRLIIALEYELHNIEKSFWSPYLNSLSSNAEHLLYWTESELDALQSPKIAKEIQDLKRDISTIYTKLFPYLQTTYPEVWKYNHSLETFMHASISVWSRGFDAVARGDTNRHLWILVPMGDIINHQSYIPGYYSDLNKGDESHFNMWSPESYGHGAQVFQSYGQNKLNGHYLTFYGFLPEGSEGGDVVVFKFAKGILKRLQGNWVQGHAGVDGLINSQYFHSFGSYLKNAGLVTDFDDGIQESIKLTLVALRDAYASMGTTLEEDFAMLQAGKFKNYREQLAITVRFRIKRILVEVEKNLAYRLKNPGSWLSKKKTWLTIYNSTSYFSRRDGQIEVQESCLFQVNIPNPI